MGIDPAIDRSLRDFWTLETWITTSAMRPARRCSPRSTTKQHVVQLLFGFAALADILPTTCYWCGYVVVGLVTGTSTVSGSCEGHVVGVAILTPACDQAARVAACRLGYSCRYW